MKLKALHLFLILLASLILSSCLGQFTVEGMAGSRRRGGSSRSTVTDTTDDTVTDSVMSSIKDSSTGSGISGMVFWA